MSALGELIERLEKATGPDRELDVLVARTCGWRPLNDFGKWWIDPEEVHHNYLPFFSQSIDGAIILVPSGKQWAVWGEERPQARVYEADDNGGVLLGRSWECCEAHSPAIALCIAALKSRAEKS